MPALFACVTGAASNLESEAQDREPMQKGEEEKGQAMDEGYGMRVNDGVGCGVLNVEGMQVNDEGERDLGWGGFRGNRQPHPIEGALMPQFQHVKASCADGPAWRARMVGPCTRRRCGGVRRQGLTGILGVLCRLCLQGRDTRGAASGS